MHKILYTCDHCGKELDEIRDYTDMEIRDFADYIETDLCTRCYDELSDMVLQYINKKKDA
jgi:hypothetical protein